MRELLEERDVRTLALDERLAVGEVDRLAHGITGSRDRARFDAERAAGAVLDVDLKRVARIGQAAASSGADRKPRRTFELRAVVEARADDAVRTHEAAVAALDAEVGIPLRDELGDVPLLVGGGAARVGPVDGKRADGQLVAAAGEHRGRDGANELGSVRGHDLRQAARRGRALRHRDPVETVESAIDRGLVALDDLARRVGRRSSRSPS